MWENFPRQSKIKRNKALLTIFKRALLRLTRRKHQKGDKKQYIFYAYG